MSATNPLSTEASPASDLLAPEANTETDRKSSGDALKDVQQLGLVAALGSLGYVFWIVGGMEMVERFAYYGVAAVRSLYATDAVEKGGLGVNMSQFGTIAAVWALFQTFIPAVTGGLSDRYGYKETIFASTVIKIAGYLTMAFFPTYWGFFAGALLLATGTAIFKPGIQGTLVKSTSRENSSIAWGIFYQTVNIGGFLGPLLAGAMRKLAWRQVFLACAALICINFVLLLVYKEPGKEERMARNRQGTYREGQADPTQLEKPSLLREQLREIAKPHVWSYLLIFSGFWFMFNSLFDVLPNHLQDWVDTRSLVSVLFGGTEPGWLLGKLIVLSEDRTEILPEGMVNIDAGIIMVSCFLFAYLSGKMKAINSMLLGTLLAVFGLILCGYSTLGWISVIAITIFAIGEMLSSPKFSEFIGNFAPADKKAMYLGFSQVSLAIGWTLEGKLGPTIYQHLGSKEVFSRQMLLEKGWDAATVNAIAEGKAFDTLVEFLREDRWAVTRELYRIHHTSVASVWYIMGAIGIASAIGIHLYGRWIGKKAAG